MASTGQLARMRAVADDRLRNQVAALAERAGVAMPEPVTGIRDAEIRAIREREQIANVIADVLGTDLPFAELRAATDDAGDDALLFDAKVYIDADGNRTEVDIEGGQLIGMIEIEMPGIAEILTGVLPTYNAGEGRTPLSEADTAALATLIEEAFEAAYDAAEARGIAAVQDAAGDDAENDETGSDEQDAPNGADGAVPDPATAQDVAPDAPNDDEGPETPEAGSDAATAPQTAAKPKRGKAKAQADATPAGDAA